MLRNKFLVRIILIGAVGVILVLASLPVIFLYPGYRERKGLSQRLELLNQEIKDMEEKNRKIAEEIEALKNDPFYLEKLKREMGLVEEDEVVYDVIYVKEEEGEGEGESGESETSGD